MLSACCLSVCSQTFYNGSTMLFRCTMNFNKCMMSCFQSSLARCLWSVLKIMHYKKHFKSHDSHHQWFSMVTLCGTNISLSKTMIFLLQKWNVLLSWRGYRFSPCHLSELGQGALTQLAAESFAFFDQGIFCSPMLKKSLWSNYLSVGNMINAWSSDLLALNLCTLSRLRGLWSLKWFDTVIWYDMICDLMWYDMTQCSASHLQSGGHCPFELLRKVCFHHPSAHQDARQNWHLLCPWMELPVHSAVGPKVSSADSARCVLRRGSACHLHHWSPERVSVTVRYLVGKRFARRCRSVHCLRKHYQVLMVDHDHHFFEVLLHPRHC